MVGGYMRVCNNFKLKPSIELELSLLLQNKFINKISSVVGRDFEDLMCKYVDGDFTQTNINAVESAFCDIKKDDTYYSIKYSKSVQNKPLSTVTGDNFRYTTIAKMISQSVLMSEGKYTHELSQINSIRELSEFMKDKNITKNKFGVVAGFSWIEPRSDWEIGRMVPKVVLKLQYSNILTGQELYNKLLNVYKEFGDMKKELRSHVITKIFGHNGTRTHELPMGDSKRASLKKNIQENVMDAILDTPHSLIEK